MKPALTLRHYVYVFPILILPPEYLQRILSGKHRVPEFRPIRISLISNGNYFLFLLNENNAGHLTRISRRGNVNFRKLQNISK